MSEKEEIEAQPTPSEALNEEEESSAAVQDTNFMTCREGQATKVEGESHEEANKKLRGKLRELSFQAEVDRQEIQRLKDDLLKQQQLNVTQVRDSLVVQARVASAEEELLKS
mmetsp:Transcript_8677/g.14720  ORF Transcript_8677/g.14720 Transcript_8677/m.14720 type:complete len:112 (+) Transcript_8677:16-351(+)